MNGYFSFVSGSKGTRICQKQLVKSSIENSFALESPDRDVPKTVVQLRKWITNIICYRIQFSKARSVTSVLIPHLWIYLGHRAHTFSDIPNIFFVHKVHSEGGKRVHSGKLCNYA